MKFTKSKLFFAAAMAAIIALFLAAGIPAQAQLSNLSGVYQTGQPNFFNLDTNTALFQVATNGTLTYGAGTTTNTYIKTVRQNQGLGLFLAVWQTNAVGCGTNVFYTNLPPTTLNNVRKIQLTKIVATGTAHTVYFDVTGDGNTWTKGSGAYPLSWSVPLTTTFPGTYFGSFGYSQSAQ